MMIELVLFVIRRLVDELEGCSRVTRMTATERVGKGLDAFCIAMTSALMRDDCCLAIRTRATGREAAEDLRITLAGYLEGGFDVQSTITIKLCYYTTYLSLVKHVHLPGASTLLVREFWMTTVDSRAWRVLLDKAKVELRALFAENSGSVTDEEV